MNIAAIAHRFFLFGGALLVVIALVQLRLHRRARAGEKDRPTSHNPIDANLMRVILFGAIGILAILVGAGVIPMNRLR